jgi:hypothetical protein
MENMRREYGLQFHSPGVLRIDWGASSSHHYGDNDCCECGNSNNGTNDEVHAGAVRFGGLKLAEQRASLNLALIDSTVGCAHFAAWVLQVAGLCVSLEHEAVVHDVAVVWHSAILQDSLEVTAVAVSVGITANDTLDAFPVSPSVALHFTTSTLARGNVAIFGHGSGSATPLAGHTMEAPVQGSLVASCTVCTNGVNVDDGAGVHSVGSSSLSHTHLHVLSDTLLDGHDLAVVRLGLGLAFRAN